MAFTSTILMNNIDPVVPKIHLLQVSSLQGSRHAPCGTPTSCLWAAGWSRCIPSSKLSWRPSSMSPQYLEASTSLFNLAKMIQQKHCWPKNGRPNFFIVFPCFLNCCFVYFDVFILTYLDVILGLANRCQPPNVPKKLPQDLFGQLMQLDPSREHLATPGGWDTLRPAKTSKYGSDSFRHSIAARLQVDDNSDPT